MNACTELSWSKTLYHDGSIIFFMGSVNIADSVLEEQVEEEGDPDGPLQWDKSNESFTDHYERLLELADPEGEEVELSEDQEEELMNKFERKLQEYARG